MVALDKKTADSGGIRFSPYLPMDYEIAPNSLRTISLYVHNVLQYDEEATPLKAALYPP